jgi:hypothetical protein
LKRKGKVYTAIIPDAKTETILPIIKEKVALSTLTPLGLTMPWMFPAFTMCALTTQNAVITTSTALKTFGTKLNVICAVLTASKRNTSTGF